MKKFATTLLMTLLLLASVASVHAQELPNPGITPDSWLYGFDKAFERLQMIFTFDPAARAELHVRLAGERLAEAKVMADRGKPEFVPELTKEYEVNVNKSNEIAAVAQQAGKNITRLNELIALATSVHTEVLEEVYTKVPEVAKPAIAKAIDVSIRGQEKSLDRLGEVVPERSAELYVEFAEKRLMNAKEKATEGRVEEVEKLVGEYERKVNKSLELVERAEGLGRNMTALAEHISNTTYTHIGILEEIYERVPEYAEPALLHAINVSIVGHERAVEKILTRVNKTVEKVEEFNCTTDTDCIGLVCPMVLGSDTPVCKEMKICPPIYPFNESLCKVVKRCTCGGKWELVNKTEWKERFKEEWTNETGKRLEKIEEMYNQTEIEKSMRKMR